MDDVTTAERRAAIDAAALATLHANRNLGEDFVAVEAVEGQDHSLCAELELEGDADTDRVAARLAYDVQRYPAPPKTTTAVRNARPPPRRRQPLHGGGNLRGARLDHGFIDDDELWRPTCAARSVLRHRRHHHGHPRRRAVRDIVNALAADGTAIPPADKWRLAVPWQQPGSPRAMAGWSSTSAISPSPQIRLGGGASTP